MNYIKDYLNKFSPLKPIPTSVATNFDTTKKYKAFVFDIYGTILISASGDINHAHPSARHIFDAFWENGITCGDNFSMIEVAEEFILAVREEIKIVHENEKASGNSYPEVVIEEVADTVLKRFFSDGKLVEPSEGVDLKKLIFIIECKSNVVWPMPSLKEVLNKIDAAGKVLGIISNAQFYTPLIVNHFVNSTYETTAEIPPFKRDLIQYSFQMRKGKPDASLFKSVMDILKNTYSIEPSESLYIGNDMLNDIYPADQCGIDTALFAGDERSLRLREDDDRVSSLSPTHIINDLSQLLEFV